MYLWVVDNGEIKRRHQIFALLIQFLPLVFIFIVMPLLAHIIGVIDKK